MRLFTAFLSGLLFAVGLAVGGMTLPSKVVGFLDVAGAWDPSLAFVMLGAIAVYGVGYRLVARRGRTVTGEALHVPSSTRIDRRLLVGSALFGIGWGLGGYCPGPGLTAAGTGAGSAVIFAASMAAGAWLHHVWRTRRATSTEAVAS